MRQIDQVVRSATLTGYIELVRSLGRDPHAFLRTVGLKAELLEDPETLIQRDAVRELLEITARATRKMRFRGGDDLNPRACTGDDPLLLLAGPECPSGHCPL